METQLRLPGMNSRSLISYVEDFHAKHLAQQDTGKDLTTQEKRYFLISQGFYPYVNLDTWCLKTLKVYLLTKKDEHSFVSCPFLPKWGITLNGKFLIASITESHNPEKESLLQDILESKVDQKYYLTNKLWEYLDNRKKDPSHTFGYNMADRQGQTKTLTARYRFDGQEILLEDILEDEVDEKYYVYNQTKDRLENNIVSKKDIAATLQTPGFHSDMTLIRLDDNPKLSQGQRVYDSNGLAATVTTNNTAMPYYKMKSNVRRLTPLEAERLQGFPDNWTKGLSDTQRYKTLGNAVTVNVITSVMNKFFKGSEYERE